MCGGTPCCGREAIFALRMRYISWPVWPVNVLPSAGFGAHEEIGGAFHVYSLLCLS
jgi:hypothetical protein